MESNVHIKTSLIGNRLHPVEVKIGEATVRVGIVDGQAVITSIVSDGEQVYPVPTSPIVTTRSLDRGDCGDEFVPCRLPDDCGYL